MTSSTLQFVATRRLEVARRRSGGGAVLVDESVVWIDFADRA